MSQRQQLERIFEIDRSIRAGEFPNATWLAGILEVSKRVIYNDRVFMIDRLGAPIVYDQEKGGWYYNNETWTLPNTMITEGELMALFLSLEISRRYLGTALEGSLRSAVDKISRSVKGPVSVDLDALKAHYTFASPALSDVREQILLELHRAIRANHRLRMRYYTASRDEHTDRTVSPYHLYHAQGEWYLIAFDDFRQEIRNFAVGRIEDWSILTDTFERDAGFSIQEHMGSAFQTERGSEIVEVAIRFDPHQARYIRERRWHETQRIEEQPDGGLILSFQSSGLGEVKRWVMQYGGHAEVVGPVSLRQECSDEAHRLVRLYGALSLNGKRYVDEH